MGIHNWMKPNDHKISTKRFKTYSHFSKWCKPFCISRSYSVIVRVRVLLVSPKNQFLFKTTLTGTISLFEVLKTAILSRFTYFCSLCGKILQFVIWNTMRKKLQLKSHWSDLLLQTSFFLTKLTDNTTLFLWVCVRRKFQGKTSWVTNMGSTYVSEATQTHRM